MAGHFIAAAIGFALSTWLTLIALAAQAMWDTKDESSFVQFRRSKGWPMSLGFFDTGLRVQLIVAYGVTLLAWLFTLWQLALGILA